MDALETDVIGVAFATADDELRPNTVASMLRQLQDEDTEYVTIPAGQAAFILKQMGQLVVANQAWDRVLDGERG
jgi:hypothetical protein